MSRKKSHFYEFQLWPRFLFLECTETQRGMDIWRPPLTKRSRVSRVRTTETATCRTPTRTQRPKSIFPGPGSPKLDFSTGTIAAVSHHPFQFLGFMGSVFEFILSIRLFYV